MEWIILLLVTAFCAGVIGSLIGLGGGIILVPAILFFHSSLGLLGDLTPQKAVGISTIMMIFTGLSSTLAYVKHKRVDYKTGFIFFIGSGPGGILGSYVNKMLDVQSFYLFFGMFVIIVSIVLLIKDQLKPSTLINKATIKKVYTDSDGKQYIYGFKPSIAIMICFAVGFCSGLFGIGGGSLIVPTMILLFLFPPHVAVATSMFIVFLSSITNSITHITLGNVVWHYALVLIPGAWFGAKLGAYINSKLKGNTLVRLLRVMLLLIGIKLIIEGIS
ncbi:MULTISPECIES: sulfite exporter TauE/SafE family protein [Bacillus]|uniref:sulfite exporter TauE/SafE family protein n=1 Tax=Bacillus TaxID=1386 RepID=UPI0002E23FD4|nr:MULTISPECIES: sulfite exporter TauE/SafE family protein [Bacillus]